MTYRDVCLLLPCHSLEDFPMHYEGLEAAGLLSAWTAMWHPGLLGTSQAAPNWHRSSSPPADATDQLILIPSVSRDDLPAGFVERAEGEGARIISGDFEREALLAQALEPLADRLGRLDPSIEADFLALGYAYLQVELLTRQMRYATNLDEIHFQNQAIAGAKAALEGDDQTAKERLHSCFDLLSQERDHYYAVDAYVLDLTLLARETLGEPLAQELQSDHPVNILATADLLSRMQQAAPETFAALREGLSNEAVGLVGGEFRELRTPLYSCESVLRQIRLGLLGFQQLIGSRPTIYGRRRFGMTTLYPQLLDRLGYAGVLHATLDAGKFPEGSQAKLRWEGLDHTAIDTLARVPLDASKPESFLSLASKLGETMDMDHIATIYFAHWPGKVSPWYRDLRRVARYGPMLGKFVTVEEYFRDTDYAGQLEQFHADQYQSPYLRQSVERGEVDPISRWVRYWRRQAAAETAQSLECLVALLTNRRQTRAAAWLDQLATESDQADGDDLDQPMADHVDKLAQQLDGHVPRDEGDATRGYLALNPSSNVRRMYLQLPELDGLPTVEKPVYAADGTQESKRVVVDVPPMGFAWITGGAAPKTNKRNAKNLAEDDRLFNEFFEARVDSKTGAVKALYDYERRGNRLSQQIVFRSPKLDPSQQGDAAHYSVMAADRVSVTASNAAFGEITSEGRLVDRAGNRLATFRQRTQVWRGSRVLRLKIEVQPQREPTGDPWNCYYACRFAWPTQAANLWRGMNQLRERAEAKRFEAPSYIEVDETNHQITIFPLGLPYHRRTDFRMLDSLLIVPGEQARSFELGVGVNVKYPLQESVNSLAPQPVVARTASTPQAGTCSWLFHISSRNVLATHWEPEMVDDAMVGFRVRLLETSGRHAEAKLQSYRPVSSARLVDFAGETKGDCRVEEGAISFELTANQWLELVAHW
jgi:alpha-mannosidase